MELACEIIYTMQRQRVVNINIIISLNTALFNYIDLLDSSPYILFFHYIDKIILISNIISLFNGELDV